MTGPGVWSMSTLGERGIVEREVNNRVDLPDRLGT